MWTQFVRRLVAGPTIDAAGWADRGVSVLLECSERRTQRRSKRCRRTIGIDVASFAWWFSLTPFRSTILQWSLGIYFQRSHCCASLSIGCKVGTLTWNHTWTRDSLRCNFRASSSRANTSGYGARSNARSSSSNWNAVNVVLNDGEEKMRWKWDQTHTLIVQKCEAKLLSNYKSVAKLFFGPPNHEEWKWTENSVQWGIQDSAIFPN